MPSIVSVDSHFLYIEASAEIRDMFSGLREESKAGENVGSEMDKWPPLPVELEHDEGMYALRHKRNATSGEKWFNVQRRVIHF